PGALRALELAHRRHGRMPWARLFEDAIRLAKDGFPMPRRLSLLLSGEAQLPKSAAPRALYYDANGRPGPAGSKVVNAAYAATLAQIALGGADVFYRGPIAADIVAAVHGHVRPGDLSMEDLAGYQAKERAPV